MWALAARHPLIPLLLSVSLSSYTGQCMETPESEKPMSHGGIATWKVFARPESFCALLPNPPLKDMPKCTDF